MATATSTIELATIDVKHEQLPSSEDEVEEDRSFEGGNHIGGDVEAKRNHANGLPIKKLKLENSTNVLLANELIASVDETHINEDFPGNQFIERYKCHHCEKSYKNLRSLNQHFREVQVCRVCKKSFPSIEAFTSHILEDHTVGALCGVCMNSFRSRARLVEHVSTHTQLAVKKPDTSRARKHAAAAAAELARACKLCGQELSPLSPHTCHANVCKICRKPLRTRSEFEVHMMRLHCSEDACQFCGVRLSSIPSLISHLKSHTSLRYPAHKCVKCSARFSTAARLSAHVCQRVLSPPHSPTKSSTNSTSPSKPVEKSNMMTPEKHSTASSNTSLEDIPKSQLDNLKYECQWCEQKFKYLRDLKRHRLELHSCKFCKKILKTKLEFEKHLMEEHSSKDECQFCLRKFVCTNALRTHLKTHTQITHKLHQCKKCKRKFANVKDKLKHDCLKFHCFLCEEVFGTESEMESHRIKDHPNSTLLNCNYCSKTLPTKEALKKHIKIKHCSIKKTKE